ncbi:MAG TPA: lysylphosphatidylglycerol synthase transmembrane domain-containing protein [Edaphobacter sp.]|jgi:glycosyltransferase 2 family protein|nr:lysylphosphatidylglycerol synthase transmembrane domain-containing protein [Edaphobacter sp.]
MITSSTRNLLKTVPGLAISAFFLWYTFKGISFAQIRALRLIHPVWIIGVLLFTFASYALRCVRWTHMMRSTGAKFAVCARVLMTSLAANNILPLRIGDIMRVFTYAGDLGASPSAILSTVILEKLLDIFTLVLLFVAFMGSGVAPHYRFIAYLTLAISTIGLLILILGARVLEKPIRKLFAKLPQNPRLAKVEHWLLLALDCIRQIGIIGSLLLLLQSAIIWTCEGMIFVSAAHLIGLVVDRIGPWQAVSAANLSYLIPSSPGAIGTFELAVRTSLVSHGAGASQAAIYGLALHAWLLISVTGAGGIIFLLHRFRTHNREPLLKEIETLPAEMP